MSSNGTSALGDGSLRSSSSIFRHPAFAPGLSTMARAGAGRSEPDDRRGEMFAFLGPNGGGKTTLFRLLSTLIPLQSARSEILGFDLRPAGDRRAGRDWRRVSGPQPRQEAHGAPRTFGTRAICMACRARAARAAATRCLSGSGWPIAPASGSKRSRADCGGASNWPRA